MHLHTRPPQKERQKGRQKCTYTVRTTVFGWGGELSDVVQLAMTLRGQKQKQASVPHTASSGWALLGFADSSS